MIKALKLFYEIVAPHSSTRILNMQYHKKRGVVALSVPEKLKVYAKGKNLTADVVEFLLDEHPTSKIICIADTTHEQHKIEKALFAAMCEKYNVMPYQVITVRDITDYLHNYLVGVNEPLAFEL